MMASPRTRMWKRNWPCNFSSGAGVASPKMNSCGSASFKRRCNVSADNFARPSWAERTVIRIGVFEWWKTAALPKFELLLKVAGEIVVARKLDRRTERRVSLHKDFARCFSASGASGDLREKLKRAFAGAEIGQMQGEIGIDDSDQSHIWKMQTLSRSFVCQRGCRSLPVRKFLRVSRYASLRVIESASMRRTTAFGKICDDG